MDELPPAPQTGNLGPVAFFIYKLGRVRAVGLKETVSKIYRLYLKRILIIRVTKNAVFAAYRTSRRWQREILLRAVGERYKLLPLTTYVQRFGCTIKVLGESEEVVIASPQFLGTITPTSNDGPLITVNCPQLALYQLGAAAVVGNSHFVLAQGYAVHPDFYVASQEICPAETIGALVVAPRRSSVLASFGGPTPVIARGVSLCGQCTANYAHWLTEALPKLVLVDSCSQFDDLPLLVDGGLNRNIYESIDRLNVKRRPVVLVEPNVKIFVQDLVVLSAPGYTPYEARGLIETGNMVENGPHWFHFSRRALTQMRDAAWNAIPNEDRHARRIYLHRPPEMHGRLPVNQAAVEALLVTYGVEIVDTGSMGFADQVTMFRNAELVIAPVGAALANMIWAPKGCRVLCLAPYRENLSYYYYSNLLSLLGHDLRYILGEQVKFGDHPIHRDYHADLEALRRAVEKAGI